MTSAIDEADTAREHTDDSELRRSAKVAETERNRLAARATSGPVGAFGIAIAARLRSLGSEATAKKGLRYQPVVWTVLAIIAISFFVPGRPTGGDAQTAGSFRLDTSGGAVTTIAPAPSATPTTFAAPATTVAAPTPTTGSFSPPTTRAFTPPPTTQRSPNPTPTTAAPPPTTAAPPPTTAAPVASPLTISASTWAASLAGTPAATNGVPDGSLPIGNRLGTLDKASFVRLSGTETTLTLTEDTDGSNEAFGAATMQACLITTPGWAEGEAQTFAEAPKWDAENCVAGVEANNSWTFDLGGYSDRTGQAGFALLPGAGAPPEFQIAFNK